MVHTNVKYIGIWIQKWIGSISSAIFKCFEIKINRSTLFQNISENVKTSLWLKIAFKVDEMRTYRVISCFWVIGSKSKLAAFGSINYSWFLTYSLRAFLPVKVWKAIPNGLSQAKICPVSWSKTKFRLFLLIINLNTENCILFSNCKTWTIFSLTKHNASLWPHYFYIALGENWQFLGHDKNLQKKKSLQFHPPHIVPLAPYFHPIELDLLPGLFHHPFHYYFRSVWHIYAMFCFYMSSKALNVCVFIDSIRYVT